MGGDEKLEWMPVLAPLFGPTCLGVPQTVRPRISFAGHTDDSCQLGTFMIDITLRFCEEHSSVFDVQYRLAHNVYNC